MTILAIDTSTDYLSLAIVKGGRTIAKFHKKAPRRHSILLVPMIDKLLKKARLKIKDIGCFAMSVGPGSFTGLRIGVTVVKGLAYALKKPIVAVPTLDAIAYNAARYGGVICPVLDARKNKVYACLYRSDGKKLKRLSRYLLLPLAELLKKTEKYDKVIFLGDATSDPASDMAGITVRCGIGHKAGYRVDWYPRAEVVARLGAELISMKKFVNAEDLEPMYIYSRECDLTGW
jgi:tRNA threonylcarbamoyladenosine biosynthesis protein TsaB